MSYRSSPRTTGRVAVACLVATSTLMLMWHPATAAGADESDPGTADTATAPTTTAPVRVEAASSDRDVAEASVASLRTDRAAVRAELAAAQAARDRQFDRWALTQLAMEAAQGEVMRTADLVERAQREVLITQRRVRAYATEAFMHPPALESLSVLSIDDAEEASRAHDLLSITADDQNRVVDELAAAKATAERRATRAAEAAAQSAARESESKAELEKLEASLQRQRRLNADIEDRLDGALAEVASLEAVDRTAAQELEEEERALAADSRATVAGAGAQRSPRTTSGGSSSPTPGTTSPPRTAPRPAPSGPPPPPPAGVVTWSDVTKVGGIWVNKSIANQVRGLLSAASASGFSLSGGGFRDPASQIQLRQAHCGPTKYDIYERPASQCTPPTARPGRSMHERGLAIDFKSSGHLITSRSDPAFQWLAANASAYGFYNLPSEPWHWSVNGT